MISVGVIGARRKRQGLGPFVVRDLRAGGAEVPCFLATSEVTRDAARRDLAERCGVEARGYLDLEAMLSAEKLDALAILSPAETHERYLNAALAAELHVLCEKPLVWGRPDLAATAARIAGAFEARGLAVWENCQWPYTLRAFEALHPGALEAPPRCFEMRLRPASRGAQMLGDAMPHALSLLQTLVPGPAPAVEEPTFSSGDPEARELTVEFLYRTRTAASRVQVQLKQADSYPREAELAIDGRRARRLVALEGYRLSFTADGRTVPVADPLGLLIADFVRELSDRCGTAASRSGEIAARMQLLEAIVATHASLGRNAGEKR